MTRRITARVLEAWRTAARVLHGPGRGRWHALSRAGRQLLGAPDYDRYRAHMAAHHPGETPLSRREYCARTVDRRYGAHGPRCC